MTFHYQPESFVEDDEYTEEMFNSELQKIKFQKHLLMFLNESKYIEHIKMYVL